MNKTVNDLFQQSKTDWLKEARDTARKLLRTRHHITIEDVLEITPLPKYLHRNTIGAVFNNEDFRAVGYTKSRRTAMHSRTIKMWSNMTVPDADITTGEWPKGWKNMRRSDSVMGIE